MEASYLDEHFLDANAGGPDEANQVTTWTDLKTNNDSNPNTTLESTDCVKARYVSELHQIEEEIRTLRQVLVSKISRQNSLKRKLGITPITEMKEEVKQGIDTLRASDAYQFTSTAVRAAKDKTSAVITEKWNLLRQSNTCKVLENKMGSVYSSMRDKLSSRPTKVGLVNNNSTQSELGNLRTSFTEASISTTEKPKSSISIEDKSDLMQDYDIDPIIMQCTESHDDDDITHDDELSKTAGYRAIQYWIYSLVMGILAGKIAIACYEKICTVNE